MISLLQILEQCYLTDYDICFVQIGENDVKTAKDDPLGLSESDLNLNSLLVKRQIDNPSPGAVTGGN